MKKSRRMSFIDIPAVEKAVRARGWTMRDFLNQRAKISESTWYRWKDADSGIKPNTATIEIVHSALEKLPIKKTKQ